MAEKLTNIVLCGANSYNQKYYFNHAFDRLPDAVKQELQVMCVWFTEDIGGILTIDRKSTRLNSSHT